MNKQIHFKDSTGSPEHCVAAPIFPATKAQGISSPRTKGNKLMGCLEKTLPQCYTPWGFPRKKIKKPILRQGETPMGFQNNAGSVGFILCRISPCGSRSFPLPPAKLQSRAEGGRMCTKPGILGSTFQSFLPNSGLPGLSQAGILLGMSWERPRCQRCPLHPPLAERDTAALRGAEGHSHTGNLWEKAPKPWAECRSPC